MKPLMKLGSCNHFFHMAVIILLKSLLVELLSTQEPREKVNIWPPRARQKHWALLDPSPVSEGKAGHLRPERSTLTLA